MRYRVNSEKGGSGNESKIYSGQDRRLDLRTHMRDHLDHLRRTHGQPCSEVSVRNGVPDQA